MRFLVLDWWSRRVCGTGKSGKAGVVVSFGGSWVGNLFFRMCCRVRFDLGAKVCFFNGCDELWMVLGGVKAWSLCQSIGVCCGRLVGGEWRC